jgi:glycosyltransferase involved in cell wall biosynthesis
MKSESKLKTYQVSVILPALNEAENLEELLPQLKKYSKDYQIIVVDDGSTDSTQAVCKRNEVQYLKHPYQIGNGAAIKTGARAADGDILVFMDADGQHDPSFIGPLLSKIDEGFDMAVGARSANSHASFLRRLANACYNRLASYMTGHLVEDLTSGFRVVRKKQFNKFLYLLPNNFSYPTTSTMAFFRAGFPVCYVSAPARARKGKSHISILKDGMRFFLIILKIGTLFSPMRVFLPVSLAFFLGGLSLYIYTFLNYGRFTNMSVLLFTTAVLTFLIGLLAELVSTLHYKETEREKV